jgi:hypothetical protein
MDDMYHFVASINRAHLTGFSALLTRLCFLLGAFITARLTNFSASANVAFSINGPDRC